jgi:hypothetical protein
MSEPPCPSRCTERETFRVASSSKDRAASMAGQRRFRGASEPAHAQPSCLIAHPAFQIFVMCRILSPSNSMT